MALIKEMKKLTGVTEREQDILDYILAHPEEIAALSSRELGRVTYTSAATVTRFCQKLGLKGYPEFKLKFVSELGQMENGEAEENIFISERENAVSMVRKATEIQKKAVEETRRELSFEQLVRIAKLVAAADYIDIYAYDTNIYLAQYGCTQFFHAGKIANAYAVTNVQGLLALNPAPGHLSILISHTGENSRLMEIARLLRRKGAKIIVIAADKNRALSKFADEFLHAEAPKTMAEFWHASFFASAKYLLDILFGMEFSRRYEDNMELNAKYEKSGQSFLWGLIHDV